jgi:23S rRNA (uracil747-C5)-methyltransferase
MNTFCSYYNLGICRSCNRIEDTYEHQLQLKSEKLSKLLAHFPLIEQLPSVPSERQGFRNKAKFTVTGTLENPIIGLTGESELDKGREITNCLLHHPEINKILQQIPSFIEKAKLVPYQIKSKTGELKGIIVYFSQESQEMYLRLILRSKESLDRIKKNSSFFIHEKSLVTCLSANIQPIPHAILEGEEEIFFTENHFIHHQMGEIRMTLHPQGFVQTNQKIAQKLYMTAANWVQEIKPHTFVELFSGQGAFSFFIQSFVTKAVGVEINPDAVRRAHLTASENQWNHLSFIAQDAGAVLKEVLSLRPDILLVNPPRRGLGQAIELVKKIQSPYFIYSSCNAETLAQDLEELKTHYSPLRSQLFDMFPHTDHFETLVLLKLTEGDKTESSY